MQFLNQFLLNGNVMGFYLLALVAIWASLRVVTHANPVHAILSMIVSLLAVAGIFFIMGAPFAGVLEMIVYAGAILVLFVFVIMMLNLGSDAFEERSWLTASAWATPVCLTLIIGAVLIGLLAGGDKGLVQGNAIGVKEIGIGLFTKYLLLIEVAGFLLLGALVAAYHLGKKALDDENVSHYQNEHDTPNRQPDIPVFSQRKFAQIKQKGDK